MYCGDDVRSKQLQLFAWHGDRRFLFIATAGGAYDLVKDQPVSDQTLAGLHEEFQRLSDAIEHQRRWGASVAETGAAVTAAGVRKLGNLIGRIILHPDIRRLLSEQEFSEITISTNQFAIPWELVQAGNSFIGLKWPVTRRVQSSRPLASGVRVVFRSRLKVLIVFNPTSDLPATEGEASKIETLLGLAPDRFEVCTLGRESCTRFELLRLIAEADIFHYAGHAYFDRDRPEQSGLLLSDGPLLASELENYLDQTAPLLVFLSACESSAFAGSERLIGGQQMASLAHPFITCGCAAFIGSSLPVGDTQAAEFATTVYDHLSRGDTISVSTWNARRAIADRFGLEDPTWSSFLLFGDGTLQVVLTPDQVPITSERIRSSVQNAAEWLRRERRETGIWCDRVYRQEAPYNAAEVALALSAAGVIMDEDEKQATISLVVRAHACGYSAAPYEPANVGPFTSCAAYILQALELFRVDAGADDTLIISTARENAVNQLLSMQHSTGGWSWGVPVTGVGPYTLFTIEALDALQVVANSEPKVRASVLAGLRYLRAAQNTDGGWSYRDGVQDSDPSSTCYALCALLSSTSDIQQERIEYALHYLQTHLNLSQLTDSQFFVDHRIEVPGLPRNAWPHYEDYSGIAALCQLLIIKPELERTLYTSGIRQTLIAYLLNNQEEGRGWPKVYSTIYVTNYYMQVLVAAADALDGLER